MKLTMALMLFASMHLYAKGFSQTKVTIKLDQVELKYALQQIEQKSQFRFLYNQSILKKAKKVTLVANEMPLDDLMNAMLAGTGISYRLVNENLVVLNAAGELAPDPITVKGKITDGNGQPVPGASVTVKGTTNGVAADENGSFSIQAATGSKLVFSALGFESKELIVGSDGNMNVGLIAQSNNLNEVVVIGYGTASKRDLTGSIVKISGKEVADKPNVNPIASLQGRVAGLSVVNSGTPGAEPDIRLRGTVSIGGIRPLYVVDGIFNDNINYLNPNDIESIEVLKDPSSLAIFGIRGAAGVIAITTKRAKSGQMNVNFNSTFGVKRLVDKIDMVDAAGFKELFEEEQTNLGITGADRFNFGPWTGNTDWIDALTRNGLFASNNLSVTASTEKNKFYMGVGYLVDEGVVKHEKLEKMLLNMSDEIKLSSWLKVGINTNFSRQKLPFSQANGLLFDARRVLPITPLMDPTNTLYTELAIQRAQIGNPLMNLENKWDKEIRTEDRFVGSVFSEITFLRDFSFRSTWYADMSWLDGRRYNPIIYTYNPSVGPNGTTYVDQNNRITGVSQSSDTWKKFQQDYILTYKKQFGDHGLTASAGFTTYSSTYTGISGNVNQRASGDSIPDDKRFWYLNNNFGDPTTRRSNSNQWERTTVSGLFRALYNFRGKYLLNASFRRDASSQISPNNRWKNFYAIGAAWELSREDFMSKVKQINFLKLKASWGVLGVQNTFGYDYPYYPGLSAGNTAVFGNNVLPAYSQAYIPNPNLTWETNTATDVGFELMAFRNRLRLDFSYFDKKTEDLMNRIRVTSGFDRLDNVGTITNRGIEASAGWTQQITKDWTVGISGNFTTFNNNVVDLGENQKFPASEERPNQTEAGFPIGYFYGYVVEGLYQSYADKLKSPKVLGFEYGPGDFKYKDINGDGLITTDDRTFIGNPTPDFIYGFSLNTNYKGFDFSIDFNGSYGNEIYRYWGSSELQFTTFNYPSFKLNRWNGEGTSNWDPALGANRTINRLPSTYGIEDGSYLRIRNMQLGYNFSTAMLSKIRFKSARVFVNVQNLKTFKNNSGYSPEFGGDALSFGIDNGNGPLPMVITGGINITF